MRRFYLDRNKDASGVSGVGRVAEGCQFDSGWCAVTWLSDIATLAWYGSIDEFMAIHGHGGMSSVTWLDEDSDDD